MLKFTNGLCANTSLDYARLFGQNAWLRGKQKNHKRLVSQSLLNLHFHPQVPKTAKTGLHTVILATVLHWYIWTPNQAWDLQSQCTVTTLPTGAFQVATFKVQYWQNLKTAPEMQVSLSNWDALLPRCWSSSWGHPEPWSPGEELQQTQVKSQRDILLESTKFWTWHPHQGRVSTFYPTVF